MLYRFHIQVFFNRTYQYLTYLNISPVRARAPICAPVCAPVRAVERAVEHAVVMCIECVVMY